MTVANGTRVRYEDIADDAEVPRSPDVTIEPESHFIALARLYPSVQWQKMSMSALVEFIDSVSQLGAVESRLSAQFDALEQRVGGFDGRINELIAVGQVRQQQITSMDTRIDNLASTIAEIQQRLHVLETSGTGTSRTTHTVHPDAVRYGVRAQDGTVRGTAETIDYPDVPALVSVTFPPATQITDEWFFDVPDDTRVTHIRNIGFTPIEELDTARPLWSLSNGTYAFTDELTPGVEGQYTITLVRVPISGTIGYGLRETDDTLRGVEHDKDYADVPVAVDMTFPQAVAANDKWFFTVPARASVSSIVRKSDGVDVTADWTHTAASAGSLDTWAFTGLTPGTAGEFTISLIERAGG